MVHIIEHIQILSVMKCKKGQSYEKHTSYYPDWRRFEKES